MKQNQTQPQPPKPPSKPHPKPEQLNLSLKVNQVKPIILELDQHHSQNQSLIKKMIKQNNSGIRYSGGYRHGGQVDAGGKKGLYRPDGDDQGQKIDAVSKVYEQLGVSKVQPKYRIIDQNNKIAQNQSYTTQQLQSKIQLLKQDRNNRNSHLLQKVDSYTLADTKSRFQNVTHVQSSLDQINLENIEAKLEAHRRNMREIQEEYNAKKGKVAPVDRYGYMKVNIDVDKEYGQLAVDQEQVYDLVRKREQMGEEQMEFEELWELKKKNDPKLAEYDAKYQQYKVSKDAKTLIGTVVRNNLFTWDKYTQPAHQHNKSKPKLHKHSQSPSKQPHQQASQQKQTSSHKKQQSLDVSKYGPDGLESIKDIRDVIAKKDDKFMAAYIFTQIDQNKVGLISKQQLHDYLLKQQFIINGYNIDTKWLFTDLDNFQTKRKGMLNKTQLSIFLATLQKLQHPKLSLTNKSNLSSLSLQTPTVTLTNPNSTSKSPIISNFPKYRPIFEKLFNLLDFNDDKLLKRTQFVENIYIDSDCVRILDQEALNIRHIGKSIKFRQIIGFILDDYEKERNDKLKKSKQYITFSRFCQYFDIPQSLDLTRIDKTTLHKKQQSSTEYDIYDLPSQYLQLLKDIFNEIPRIYQDYIICADFVQAALRDPQVLALGDELCRIASIQTKLPMETLISTLHRMQKECDQYGTWEAIKGFFSRRGRPLDWDYQLIMQKKEIRNKKMKQERSSISKSKLHQTQKYFQLSDQLRIKSKERISKLPDKYTVPQPFDITDMKQKPNLEYAQQGQKQFDELKKEFKANPVNKQILEPKPELIAGKIKKQKSVQKKAQYNYENYENDRIERALKRAQQQYDMNEKIKEIKQKTEIKAYEIGVDLTKKYQDVIKEEKKKRQNSKYKPTQPKASQSLYPKNPQGENAKKIEKIKQNMQKADEIAKRKNEMIAEDKKRAKQKNEEAKKLTEEAKKRQKEQQKKRDQIATEGLDFKPKIKKSQLSEEDRQAIRKGKQDRQKRKKQEQELRLKMLEQRKKKVLEYEKKSNFIPTDEVNQMTDEQILDKLDDINFEDLLLSEKDKKEYRKQFDNQNKTKKQLKDREAGLAGRQRAAMEEEQRRIMEEKRLYKQKLQKEKTAPKQNDSRVKAKGEKAAYEKSLNFHKSNALRRYRAIMEGKAPLSEYDKYSVKGDSQAASRVAPSQRSLPEQEQQQQQQIDQNDQQEDDQ